MAKSILHQGINAERAEVCREAALSLLILASELRPGTAPDKERNLHQRLRELSRIQLRLLDSETGIEPMRRKLAQLDHITLGA